MYSETNDSVIIKLRHSEYETLLVVLGYALGSAVQNQEPQLADVMLKLSNAINEGNPNWRRYATSEDTNPAVQ
jgi:hypothetical protein